MLPWYCYQYAKFRTANHAGADYEGFETFEKIDYTDNDTYDVQKTRVPTACKVRALNLRTQVAIRSGCLRRLPRRSR